eukprot:TRINITY_DN1294_c0_g1_i2.p2 TRINITY_DN1294_c0_g1~~TRINITY_DN1294_c0_g1_i2.p2  ORF type:complete len:110 (+),score=18.10 TRINITY_DN1294_c0_g1_i2:1150-1479(+)
MYGVDGEEMDSFCTHCCREQITDVYGKRSDEMHRFNAAISELKRGDELQPIDPFSGGQRDDQVFKWGGEGVYTEEDSDDESDPSGGDSGDDDGNVFSGTGEAMDRSGAH